MRLSTDKLRGYYTKFQVKVKGKWGIRFTGSQIEEFWDLRYATRCGFG
jgi:hypothetical protein